MANISPVPAKNHLSERRSFISKDLPNATHVFLRDDSAKSSLTPLYTGPYPVID